MRSRTAALDVMTLAIQARTRSIGFSLAGLLIAAHGCGSNAGSGGLGSGGQGGAAAGTAGITGTAGTSGIAGDGGVAGAGGAPGVDAGTSGASGTSGTSGTSGDAGPTPDDGGIDLRPDPADAGSFVPLDMNDVTILVPLPPSNAAPVLLRGADLADDGTSFVPRVLFDRLVKESELGQPILMPATHGRLQLVAVRFDLCDRQVPGACPEAEDARLRLVFQPIFTDGLSQDAGFHAFYSIENEEIAAAVAALRDLAKIAPAQAGLLRVSPALSAPNPEAYATKLRAFVKRYGGESRLVRLTVNAQPEIFGQVRWELRGVEKKGDAFVDMRIVGATAISESVFLNGTPGFDVTPLTDTPAGLSGAITQRTFDAANAATKREYLAALTTVDNPMTHTAETVACVACHVSTVVMSARAASAAIDPLTLPGRYVSTFDLSVAGGKAAETRATRALGYLGRQPMISQRVVNETAQTLKEIHERYPSP
jgi:hypothetical protein